MKQRNMKVAGRGKNKIITPKIKEIKQRNVERNKEKAEKEKQKKIQKMYSAANKLIILNRKAKTKILVAVGIAKKQIMKNKIKTEKYEIKAKKEPKLRQYYKIKIDKLNAKNLLFSKIINSFLSTERVLNKELELLAHESGALDTGNLETAKRAGRAEGACLIREKELSFSLFKSIRALKGKKPDSGKQETGNRKKSKKVKK